MGLMRDSNLITTGVFQRDVKRWRGGGEFRAAGQGLERVVRRERKEAEAE
jgi:hypothetical protein